MDNLQSQRTECIIYSRVVGWLTPTSNWNLGKKSEWKDRVVYSSSKALKDTKK